MSRPLHFPEKGVKTVVKAYQKDALEGVLKALSATLLQKTKDGFSNRTSPPAWKTETTREEEQCPEFISAEASPAGKTELNPLDYKLWSEFKNTMLQDYS